VCVERYLRNIRIETIPGNGDSRGRWNAVKDNGPNESSADLNVGTGWGISNKFGAANVQAEVRPWVYVAS